MNYIILLASSISLIITLILLIRFFLLKTKNSIANSLELLLFVLFMSQLFDFLSKFQYFGSFIDLVSPFFQLFNLLIGVCSFNLVFNLTKSNTFFLSIVNKLMFMITLFIFLFKVTLDFEITYYYDPIFGYLANFDSLFLKISRAWIGVCYFCSVVLFYIKISNDSNMLIEFRNIYIGLLLSGVIGLFCQVIWPLIFDYEIPLTGVAVSLFVIQLVSLINKKVILQIEPKDIVFKYLSDSDVVIFFLDENFRLINMNKSFYNYFNDIQRNDFIFDSPLFPFINKKLTTYNDFSYFVSLKNDYILNLRFNSLYINSIFKGYFVFGSKNAEQALFNSNVQFQKLLKLSFNYRGFLIEMLSNKNLVKINSSLVEVFNLENDVLTYKRFFLLLRGKVNLEGFKKIKSLAKSINNDKVVEYSFEISLINNKIFNVFTIFNSFNNSILFFIRDNTMIHYSTDWTQQSPTWVTSHVFRKNLANILGLINLLETSSLDYMGMNEDRELIKLLKDEATTLDSLFIRYTESLN